MVVAIVGRKRIEARSNDSLPSPFCRDPSIIRLPIPLTDGGFYFGQSRATAARNRLRSSKNWSMSIRLRVPLRPPIQILEPLFQKDTRLPIK
jgi:hypothetical protein